MIKITEEMVAAKQRNKPWPDMDGMTRNERLLEYAIRFAACMRENDPDLPLKVIVDGPFGAWQTAEMQLRIDAMHADGMTSDEIEGACRSYEFHAGLNPVEVK